MILGQEVKCQRLEQAVELVYDAQRSCAAEGPSDMRSPKAKDRFAGMYTFQHQYHEYRHPTSVPRLSLFFA